VLQFIHNTSARITKQCSNSQVIAGTTKTWNKPTTMQTHSVLTSLLSLSDSIHYIGIHTENIIWTGLESCLEVSWGYKRYADFIRTQQLQCDRSWVMCSMSLQWCMTTKLKNISWKTRQSLYNRETSYILLSKHCRVVYVNRTCAVDSFTSP